MVKSVTPLLPSFWCVFLFLITCKKDIILIQIFHRNQYQSIREIKEIEEPARSVRPMEAFTFTFLNPNLLHLYGSKISRKFRVKHRYEMLIF